jgi:hypothetical protein
MIMGRDLHSLTEYVNHQVQEKVLVFFGKIRPPVSSTRLAIGSPFLTLPLRANPDFLNILNPKCQLE